jgi:hypothetical protein
MRQLEKPKKTRRPRDKTRDQQSWRRGSGRGAASRWALKNLPPINPDDPWSTELYIEGK